MGRKKKKHQTSDKQVKHEHKESWRSWISVIIIILIAVTFNLWRSQQRQPSEGLFSEKEHNFDKEVLIPMHRRLAKTYPVEPVRKLYATMERFHSGEWDYVSSPAVGPNPPIATAGLYEGRFCIYFVVPTVMHLYGKTRQCPEYFEDSIVETMIHESLHIQMGHCTNEDNSDEESRLHESDVWWIMVEKVFLPMLKGGRMKGLPHENSHHLAILCYKIAAGDKNHEAWVTFTKRASRNKASKKQLLDVIEKYKNKVPHLH